MRAKFPYKKRRKRRGIGAGSGHGKTSCRGQKGQMSRSGATRRRGFEGGQNPLYRRLPKRGFNQAAYQTDFAVFNVGRLVALGEKEIGPELLLERGLMKKNLKLLKVLGDGEVKKPLTVRAHQFSAAAKEKIEKSGGQAVVIERWGKSDSS